MEVLASGRQVNGHHGLAAHEVVLLLEADPHRGLAEAEARSRRERYGSVTVALGGLWTRR